MIMNVLYFTAILSGSVFSILLGLFIFVNGKGRKLDTVFAFFCAALSAWLFGSYMTFSALDVATAVFWGRFVFIGVSFIPALAYHFTLTYIGDKHSRASLAATYVVSAVFLALSRTSIFSQQIIENDWGIQVQANGFYHIFIAFFVLTLINLSVKAILAFRKHGLKRQTFKMVAYSICFVSLFSSLAFLPSYGIRVVPVVFFVSLVVLCFLAWAVVRHSFMDYKAVITKAFPYFFSVLLIALVYAVGWFAVESVVLTSAPNLVHFLLEVVLAILSVLSVDYVKNGIAHTANKYFLKDYYDTDKLLEEITDEIGSTLVVQEILYKTFRSLENSMRVSSALFVVTADTRIKEYYSFGRKTPPKFSEAELKVLWQSPLLVTAEMDNGDPRKKILEKHNAALCVPLRTKDFFAGLLFVGNKQSGERYDSKDMNLFRILSRQLAIATQNAIQYQEICNFADVLQKEVRKSTQTLVRANERLTQLDKAKDQFLAMASHQLRTPLTTIKGYLHMLKEGDFGELSGPQFEGIKEAYENSDRIERLIDDLLNISRMDTGKFVLLYEPVDVIKLVTEETNRLRQRAELRHLYLKLEVLNDTVKPVMADRLKLSQVIANFVDNAIYYTREGGITVTVDQVPEGITVKVKDTGDGVPPDQQGELFHKFFRARNAQRLRPDGSGLGLFLAKSVIEAHKGQVIFESTPGHGSVFGFLLPWETGYDPKKDINSESNLKKMSLVK